MSTSLTFLNKKMARLLVAAGPSCFYLYYNE
jgi:hypothetical protein